jgi:hypothetical protein
VLSEKNIKKEHQSSRNNDNLNGLFWPFATKSKFIIAMLPIFRTALLYSKSFQVSTLVLLIAAAYEDEHGALVE